MSNNASRIDRLRGIQSNTLDSVGQQGQAQTQPVAVQSGTVIRPPGLTLPAGGAVKVDFQRPVRRVLFQNQSTSAVTLALTGYDANRGDLAFAAQSSTVYTFDVAVSSVSLCEVTGTAQAVNQGFAGGVNVIGIT